MRAFADNYIWLIELPQQPGVVVAVDPGDAAPVLTARNEAPSGYGPEAAAAYGYAPAPADIDPANDREPAPMRVARAQQDDGAYERAPQASRDDERAHDGRRDDRYAPPERDYERTPQAFDSDPGPPPPTRE